jgi:hypothetical protein
MIFLSPSGQVKKEHLEKAVVTSFQIVLKPTFDMPEIDIDSIVK